MPGLRSRRRLQIVVGAGLALAMTVTVASGAAGCAYRFTSLQGKTVGHGLESKTDPYRDCLARHRWMYNAWPINMIRDHRSKDPRNI